MPELVNLLKGTTSTAIVLMIASGQITLSSEVLNILLSVQYGNYIPGNKYYLWHTGKKEPYRSFFEKNWNMADHINLDRTVNAILKKGWGNENVSPGQSDTTNCLQFEFAQFLEEEGNNKNIKYLNNESDDGTINIIIQIVKT